MLRSFIAKRMMQSMTRLQPWDVEYMQHMCAEWRVLNASNGPDTQRINSLIECFEDPARQHLINRSHLLEFEQTLLKYRSEDALIQMAPVLRLRYRDIVGERQFAGYKEVELPKCRPIGETARLALVDDLANLVEGIHWRYVLAPFKDKERTALTLSALIWVLFYTVLWGLAVIASAKWFHSPFLAVSVTVLFCGILGGFISALRRMQSITDDSDSVIVIQSIAGATFWLWFSPLLGAVFAAVAYLFFISGLLSGSMFPDIHMVRTTARGLEEWNFWTSLVPAKPDDYAKLFLWCFISGFAERFIPDMIDRVIRRTEDAQANSAAPGLTPIVVTPAAVTPPRPPEDGQNNVEPQEQNSGSAVDQQAQQLETPPTAGVSPTQASNPS